MTAAIGQSEQRTGFHTPPFMVRDLVLLRIAAGSATRADLQRDIAPILAPRISGSEFRRAAELAISTLGNALLISETKGRLTATAKGLQVAETSLGSARSLGPAWADVKNMLVIRALETHDTASIKKAVQRLEGLAAIVLQNHFSISTSRVLSPADLRAELAIVALEKAFGNKIKTGLGKGAGLPAKPGRLLAGQLFKQPREIASDGKLIVQLASEIAGAREQSIEALELALLRRLTSTENAHDAAHIAPAPPKRPEPAHHQPRTPTPKAANDRSPLTGSVPAVARSLSPPDIAEFCSAVVDAARPVAEGWPGNRKAFISLVWKAIRNARPDWGLSEIAFKGMLAEAHRSGRVELASADLKDGRDLKSLEESKILYKNTVWHFVRVQE
jgi:hypothetical protein